MITCCCSVTSQGTQYIYKQILFTYVDEVSVVVWY